MINLATLLYNKLHWWYMHKIHSCLKHILRLFKYSIVHFEISFQFLCVNWCCDGNCLYPSPKQLIHSGWEKVLKINRSHFKRAHEIVICSNLLQIAGRNRNCCQREWAKNSELKKHVAFRVCRPLAHIFVLSSHCYFFLKFYVHSLRQLCPRIPALVSYDLTKLFRFIIVNWS